MCLFYAAGFRGGGKKKNTIWRQLGRTERHVRAFICVCAFRILFFKGVSPPSAFVSLRLHAPYYTVMTVERVRIRRTRVLLFHPRVCSSFFLFFAFFFLPLFSSSFSFNSLADILPRLFFFVVYFIAGSLFVFVVPRCAAGPPLFTAVMDLPSCALSFFFFLHFLLFFFLLHCACTYHHIHIKEKKANNNNKQTAPRRPLSCELQS